MKIITTLIIVLTFKVASSQEIIKWNNQSILFKFPEEITERDQNDSFIEIGNKNYIVGIEAVSLTDESNIFQTNIKRAAYEIAQDMKINEIEHGKKIPYIEDAYFVTGKNLNTDNSFTPVIVLVIINKATNMAYEITIDCYNNKLEQGILMAESFKLY